MRQLLNIEQERQFAGVSALPGVPELRPRLFPEPWFVAKNDCDVLGYAHAPSALASHVDDDDRKPFNLNPVENRHSIRGNPRVSVINESGLYSPIMSSKKPEAKAFRKWVTSEVLPNIRKTGSDGRQA